MVQSEKKECMCPRCQTKSEVVIWHQMDDTIKEEASEVATFQWKCPSCGHTLRFFYPCVYRNDEKHFEVRTSDAKEIEKEANLIFLTEDNANDTLRLCQSMETFTEKVRILEDGYDDRTMELLKLITFAKLHIDDASLEQIYYYRTNEEKNLEFTVLGSGEAIGVQVSPKNYANVAQIVSEELPPAEKKYLIIDRDWAASQLS